MNQEIETICPECAEQVLSAKGWANLKSWQKVLGKYAHDRVCMKCKRLIPLKEVTQASFSNDPKDIRCRIARDEKDSDSGDFPLICRCRCPFCDRCAPRTSQWRIFLRFHVAYATCTKCYEDYFNGRHAEIALDILTVLHGAKVNDQ